MLMDAALVDLFTDRFARFDFTEGEGQQEADAGERLAWPHATCCCCAARSPIVPPSARSAGSMRRCEWRRTGRNDRPWRHWHDEFDAKPVVTAPSRTHVRRGAFTPHGRNDRQTPVRGAQPARSAAQAGAAAMDDPVPGAGPCRHRGLSLYAMGTFGTIAATAVLIGRARGRPPCRGGGAPGSASRSARWCWRSRSR
ncbi:hypothetical protein AB5I41_29060 [Sphingomonas sp. MMS24-JH45]